MIWTDRTESPGVPLAMKAWTVADYGDHWLETVVVPRLRPSTVASYRDTLRLHIVPVLGRHTLRRLSPTDVRRLLAVKSGSSPLTESPLRTRRRRSAGTSR